MPKVLVIDDSATEVHILKTLLEKNDYQVITAEDGDSGIAAARSQHPDIILMDVVMPGLNGFQATRTLSKDPRTANIPVIVVSSKDQETDRVWGLRQGARDYLIKPVTEPALLEKIRGVLG